MTFIIPIVFVGVGDPVQSGFVASLARPGGNMTGLTAGAEVDAKRLELLQ
jgi:putative tryptophan/tyrosine transport system substrate-binding protein